MKGILILVLAASGWSSNSVYRSEYADIGACIDALKLMRVEQPRGDGKGNAVTAIAYCTTDPKGQDAQRSWYSDTPLDQRK